MTRTVEFLSRGRKCWTERKIAMSSNQFMEWEANSGDQQPDILCGRRTPLQPDKEASVMSWREGTGIDIGTGVLRKGRSCQTDRREVKEWGRGMRRSLEAGDENKFIHLRRGRRRNRPRGTR